MKKQYFVVFGILFVLIFASTIQAAQPHHRDRARAQKPGCDERIATDSRGACDENSMATVDSKQHRMPPDGPGRPDPFRRVLKKLNLTNDQTAQIQDFQKKQEEELRVIFTETKKKHEQLDQALAQPQISDAYIQNLVADIKQLNGRMVETHLNGLITLRRIIGDKLYDQFTSEMRQDREKMMKKMRGNKSKDDMPPPPPF